MSHFFDSIQEFLRSNQPWGQVKPPELCKFIAQVYKTSTHTDDLRELTQDCQFSWSLGRRFSRTSSHPGSAVN